MIFPLSTAVIISHKFRYVVASSSWKVSREQFRSHEYVSFLLFLLLKSIHCGLIGYRVSFQFSYICWVFLFDWVYVQIWRKFHEVLINYILLSLGEMFCGYMLGPFDSQPLLVSFFISLVSVLVICQLLRIGCWSHPLIMCVIQCRVCLVMFYECKWLVFGAYMFRMEMSSW